MRDDLHQAEDHLNAELRRLLDELHQTEDYLNSEQQLGALHQSEDRLNAKRQRLLDELHHEEGILSKKQKRLWALEDQAAIFGSLNCPVHITLEINDLRQEIQDLHRQIQEHEAIIKEIEGEIKTLRWQSKEYGATIRKTEQKIQVLRQQIKETEQKIKELIENGQEPPSPPPPPCPSPPPPSILPVLQPVPSPPAVARFHMAVYLVTNCQYKAFLNDQANGYWRPGGACVDEAKVNDCYLQHWRNGKYPKKLDHHPIRHVSWYAAQACANWLGNQLEPPLRLRLPYQEEWEIAAYAGRSGIEWWEEDLDNNRINCIATRGKTKQITTRVDAFYSNRYGLHDLLGNVYELCSLKESVGYSPGETIAEFQVIGCGGSYESRPDELLTPMLLKPNECRPDVGFRCVQDPAVIKRGSDA